MSRQKKKTNNNCTSLWFFWLPWNRYAALTFSHRLECDRIPNVYSNYVFINCDPWKMCVVTLILLQNSYLLYAINTGKTIWFDSRHERCFHLSLFFYPMFVKVTIKFTFRLQWNEKTLLRTLLMLMSYDKSFCGKWKRAHLAIILWWQHRKKAMVQTDGSAQRCLKQLHRHCNQIKPKC